MYCSPGVTRMMKSVMLRWTEHVVRMRARATCMQNLSRKHERMRAHGRIILNVYRTLQSGLFCLRIGSDD